jgi:hypothetical protein
MYKNRLFDNVYEFVDRTAELTRGMSSDDLSEDIGRYPLQERKRPSSRTLDFRRTTEQPKIPQELLRMSHSKRDKTRSGCCAELCVA